MQPTLHFYPLIVNSKDVFKMFETWNMCLIKIIGTYEINPLLKKKKRLNIKIKLRVLYEKSLDKTLR